MVRKEVRMGADATMRSLPPGVNLGIPILVAICVYAPSLRGGFVWDDSIYLHRWISGLSTLRDILLPTPSLMGAPYYKPVAALTSYLLFLLCGTWAPGWRIGGLLLHVLTVVGIHRLFRRWWAGGPNPERGAVAGATLFACWPATAEALAWISARSEPLMALLLVTALCLHLSARDKGGSGLPAASMFFLAMLSKETSLAFLAIVPAATFLLPASEGAKVAGIRAGTTTALWLPYVLAYIAYTALRRLVLGPQGSIAAVAARSIGPETITPAIRAWGYYVREALLFGPGAPYIESPPETGVVGYAVFGMALGLLAVLAALREKGRPLTMAALWFTAFLAPPMAVVAQSVSITSVAIRYLYVPCIGLAAAAAWGVSRLPDRLVRAPALAAAAITVVAFGWSIQGRVAPWLSPLALWERAYADQPRSPLTASNLAGQIETNDPERAENLYRIAAYLSVPKDPTHTQKALVQLANSYLKRERFDLARLTLRHAASFPADEQGIASAKRSAWTLALFEGTREGGRSATLSRQTVMENASALEEAIRVDPQDRAGRIMLGTLYESLGELVRARNCYRELLPLTLAAPDVNGLARERIAALDARIAAETDALRKAYFEAQQKELENDEEGAARAYERALAIDPNRVDVLLPLADLRGQRDPAAARDLLRHATTLAPNDPAVWLNFGLVSGAAGDFEGAASAFERAAFLRPEWPKPYFHLGRARDKLQDPESAIAAYEKFLARHSEEDQARRMVQNRIQQLRRN